MAHHEAIKIVDEEKQQPLLATDDEELKSCSPGKKTVSSCDMLTRVVLLGLMILTFVQWRYSVMGRDGSQTDECLQKQNSLLQLQERVQGLCMDRAALLNYFETANEEASLSSNSKHGAQYDLEEFLSSAKMEHEAIPRGLETLQKVLAVQNELLSERAAPQQVILTRLQQEFRSVCDIVAL